MKDKEKDNTFCTSNSTLPKNIIRGIIDKHGTNKFCKWFDRWRQLVSMVFCQFANSPSVRNICNGLKSATGISTIWESESPRTNPPWTIRTVIGVTLCYCLVFLEQKMKIFWMVLKKLNNNELGRFL